MRKSMQRQYAGMLMWPGKSEAEAEAEARD